MRIGVDFGGTKIEAIALDPQGATLARRRRPTPRDYDGSVAAVAELVRGLEAEIGRAAPRLGVGIPGSLSPRDGTVRNANSTWLIGRAFDRDLSAALARPVRVANDANCFALSEAMDGAGRDGRVVFGTINGTGVGGGLVVDGKVIVGRNAVGGEWGHNPLPRPADDERPGPECYCGRRGCLEVWLSGPGLAADYARAAGLAPGSGPGSDPGSRPDAREVAARAAAGEGAARAALDRLFARWGRALAEVVNILDPDVIALGGGLSNLDDAPARVFEAMRPHVFSDAVETAIRRNLHGDSSGVRGAAWLWDEETT